MKQRKYIKSAEELSALVAVKRVIYYKDENYRVQPDLWGTLSIIHVDDEPTMVFSENHLPDCYTLEETENV